MPVGKMLNVQNGGVAGGYAQLDSGLLIPRAYLPQIAGLLHNMSTTVAPTVNDDSGDGYGVGSKWFDTTADAIYTCIDATVGAAVWRKTPTKVVQNAVTINATTDQVMWADTLTSRAGGGVLVQDGTDGAAIITWYRSGTFNGINGSATLQAGGGAANIFFRAATFSGGTSGFSFYLSSNSAGATINCKNNAAYGRTFYLFEFGGNQSPAGALT